MRKGTTLVIMAAGIGSRFGGGGVKQLTPVGFHGELLIDYSLHDAIKAGFHKIVFVIRRDMEQAFREMIGDRVDRLCGTIGVETAYVYQEMDTQLPRGAAVPPDRMKPWGTGQAVLACRDVVDEPFAVLNADDYYGKTAFEKVHDFLVADHPANELCMVGFELKNTLSNFGSVTRGICRMEDGYLTELVETRGVAKTAAGAEANGVPIDPNALVSMNMWGLDPASFGRLEAGFAAFFRERKDELSTAEYLLPEMIGRELREGAIRVRVLETEDQWFGMTYKEDVDAVARQFRELITKGVYNRELFSDFEPGVPAI